MGFLCNQDKKMNANHKRFEKIILKFELGRKLLELEPIYGGALHRMWKLTTDTDVFAVKEINSHITEKDTFPINYEVSEEIASTFSQNGIPAISAIKINERYVHKVADCWYIIYPHIHAQLCSFDDLSDNQLQTVGSIFANMHNLNIKVENVDLGHYDYFKDEHWESLIKLSANNTLEKMLNFLVHCNKRFKQAIDALKTYQVVTHRDMHSLNVLWDESNRPFVIDWETAGLMNPVLEIVGYGLEWGGIIQGEFKKESTQTLLHQYKREIAQPMDGEQIKQAFYGWIGHCIMGWTEFNIRRMLGQTSRDEQEQKIGSDIINNKMIPCIQYISSNEDRLLDLAIKELT